MGDGTRVIFWVDIIILMVLTFLLLAGQWDFAIALFLALLMLTVLDRSWRRTRSKRP